MKRPGEYKHGKNLTNQTNLILPLPLRNQVFFYRINELQANSQKRGRTVDECVKHCL